MPLVAYKEYSLEGSETAASRAPCRSCGSLLEKSAYRKWIHGFGTEFTDGSGNCMEHRVCPNCGEERPLFNLLWGSVALLLLWISGSSAIFYCGTTITAFFGALLVWAPFTLTLGYLHRRHTGRSYGIRQDLE